MNKRQQLATGPGRARPPTEVEHLIDHLLNPKPIGERTRQHKPRVCDYALIVEDEREPIQPLLTAHTAARPSRHHMGDLLDAGLAAAHTARLACSGGHFARRPRRRPNNKTVDRG
ncbi:MAG: hypothetical protein M3O89_04110 [Actinomycetota bacterium]|nr:hypothetical protein [Actinomycetota bacterium]